MRKFSLREVTKYSRNWKDTWVQGKTEYICMLMQWFRETLTMLRKKKVDTKSLKRKANQRFRAQLKEFDFYWTVDSIHTSWGKIENISKDPLFISSVKTNYGFVNTVEENPAQEISNTIFDSCIFKFKIKVRAITGKIIHCSFILIMSLSNDLKWNSTFLPFNSSSLYQLFNSSISAKF